METGEYRYTLTGSRILPRQSARLVVSLRGSAEGSFLKFSQWDDGRFKDPIPRIGEHLSHDGLIYIVRDVMHSRDDFGQLVHVDVELDGAISA